MEEKTQNVSLKYFGIGKVMPFLTKYTSRIALMLFCGIATGLVDTILPLFSRYALNHYVAERTLDTLPFYICFYVFTIVFSALNNYISCTLATRLEVWLDRDLRNRAFEHLQTLSFSYFNQNSVGYIHARLISDTGKIGTLFSWTLLEGAWHLSYLAGAVVVMVIINARLAVLIIAIMPLIVLFFSIFQKKLVEVNRSVREINSRITGNFNEGITGAKTIKALVIEDKLAGDFQKETTEMKKRSVQSARVRGAFAVTLNLASSLAVALLLWRGGYIAASEVGTFSMFMAYAEGVMEPIRWIIDIISDFITTQVNIERYSRLVETVPDVVDRPEVIEKYGDSFNPKKENWEAIRGDIEFRDVDFMYPDGDEYVLKDFNLKIPFGSNVAVVGETGAGKSTIVNLICRFFEPTRGTMLIDGKDARDRSQLWLHSAIGYVLQTPHLFSGTVRDNLKYGNPGATEEQIGAALKTVSAERIVDRLEKGLDSDVGEGGDLLSTGEKQLISFARAIIADPRILILDEATASVDTLTEQQIQNAIDKVIAGRTSIVIAHRLSTVKNADIILVVKEGKIIERGKHEDLIRAGGYYCRLYTRQYEDEATDSVFSETRTL